VGKGREQLGDLRARLLALHAALLDYERRAYEETYGPTRAGELLQLLVRHDQFAWLRSLSTLITGIDEALDAHGSAAAVDMESYFEEVGRLLRSGGSGAFEVKYHDALQQSADAVMAHAEVMKVMPPSRSSNPESS
jgi:hypothetical protein